MKARSFFMVILVVLSLGSCKKRFEEGPLISFHAANNRISGNKMIESFTVNGQDSMSYIQANHLDGNWEFFNDLPNASCDLKVTSGNYTYTGFWTPLHDRSNDLDFYFRELKQSNVTIATYTNSTQLIISGGWIIIKLKNNKSMKLRKSKNGVLYELSFKPN